MKTLALPLAAALLAGCGSYPGMVEIGRAVQQAGGAAPAPVPSPGSGSTGAGSVASGGTGYLPCATAQGTPEIARPECK